MVIEARRANLVEYPEPTFTNLLDRNSNKMPWSATASKLLQYLWGPQHGSIASGVDPAGIWLSSPFSEKKVARRFAYSFRPASNLAKSC